MPTTRLPEAWAPVSPWTHRTRRRFPLWLPRRWRYRVCVTHAPQAVCTCGMYSVRYGYFPAYEGEDNGEESPVEKET
jgi:hypothetical protein